MSPLTQIVLSVLLLSVKHGEAADAGDKKMLLLLVDGFRWNYFDRFNSGELPGFDRLRQSGVSADAFIPVFPSLSFVNYYSIMTGLYAESHGMIDNYMWDEKHNEEFLIGDNPDQYHSYWWNDGEPLWITAVRQGKRAYFWYWNGCEVSIRGYNTTFCSPYQSTPDPSFASYSAGIQQAVQVLRNGTADVAGVYLERVDADGHKYGPESNEVKETVRLVDVEIGKLLDLLGNRNDINLMVFSDHGQTQRVGGPADSKSGVINILKYINETDYLRAYSSKAGPVLNVWPKPDRLQWVYDKLRTAHPNLTVYKKADIPEKYHLKNHYRVGDLYLVADEGYAIVRNANTTDLPTVGFHGWDNMRYTNMHGIFMAMGPDFKRNVKFQIGRLPNVNVYGLMCHVMQLVPSPHNGTWSDVCDGLADVNACTSGPYKTPVVSAACCWKAEWLGVLIGSVVLGVWHQLPILHV